MRSTWRIDSLFRSCRALVLQRVQVPGQGATGQRPVAGAHLPLRRKRRPRRAHPGTPPPLLRCRAGVGTPAPRASIASPLPCRHPGQRGGQGCCPPPPRRPPPPSASPRAPRVARRASAARQRGWCPTLLVRVRRRAGRACGLRASPTRLVTRGGAQATPPDRLKDLVCRPRRSESPAARARRAEPRRAVARRAPWGGAVRDARLAYVGRRSGSRRRSLSSLLFCSLLGPDIGAAVWKPPACAVACAGSTMSACASVHSRGARLRKGNAWSGASLKDGGQV